MALGRMRFGQAGGPVVGVVLGSELGLGLGLGLGLIIGAGVSGQGGAGLVIGVLGLGLGLGLGPGIDIGNGTLGGYMEAATIGTDAIGCVGCAAGGGVATLGAETVGLSTAMAKMLASWRR